MNRKSENPQAKPVQPELPKSGGEPEEKPNSSTEQIREKMLDKTLADSFPTSDPPSSIPDPGEDDSFAA